MIIIIIITRYQRYRCTVGTVRDTAFAEVPLTVEVMGPQITKNSPDTRFDDQYDECGGHDDDGHDDEGNDDHDNAVLFWQGVQWNQHCPPMYQQWHPRTRGV